MSYQFVQTPEPLQLAQSPVVFSVESSQYVSNPQFMYVGELEIWTGSFSNSSSVELWTLSKYPSLEGLAGIFDCSRIINSTQTELVQQNASPIKNYKFTSYYRYWNGTQYVTGDPITSSVYQAADGYEIFPQQINAPIKNSTVTPYNYWPLMLDGPQSQSCFIENKGLGYVYMKAASSGDITPTRIKYEDNLGNVAYYTNLTSSVVNSNNLVQTFPMYPTETGFPNTIVPTSWYKITAVNNTTPVSSTLHFNVVCKQKYPNIRIKFKNRFGAFQYINMDMVNRKSFSTTKRTYQPQLGTWAGTTLSYNEYDSQTLNYIVDSTQRIVCNTNWLEEQWNEIIKQLLVSDEIYWCNEGEIPTYDSTTWTVKPLTITTQNVTFKTGVNDHLIQYAFEFDYGQGYKLII